MGKSTSQTGLRAQDSTLVRRAMAGEQSGIDELLERLRCVPRMLASKNAQLGRPLDADELADVSQATIIAVWRKLERYNGTTPIEAWVYGFSLLELAARIRKRERQPEALNELQHDPSLTTSAEDPLRFEELYRGLETLGPPGGEIIRLKHFEELTFDEIGERLQVSPNTAKTWYYRSLPKLRRLLTETDQVQESES